MNRSQVNQQISEINPRQFLLVLFVVTFLFTNGFYLKVLEPFLEPREHLSIAGAVFALSTCVFLWFKKHTALREVMRSRYGKMVLLFFVLIIVPTVLIGSIVTQRQPIFRPSLVVIRVYAGLLFFFWLAVYCSTERLFLLLHRFFLYLGLVWIVISLLFFLFPDLVMLLFKVPGKEFGYRADIPRFVPPTGIRNVMMYSCFYAMVKLFQKAQPVNLKWGLVFMAGLFAFLFPLSIRRNVFVLIVVPLLFWSFFLDTSKKVLVGFFALNLLIISFLMFPSFFDRVDWVFDSVIDEYQSSEKTSTNVRLSSLKYYFPELVDSFFIGFGYFGADKISPNHRLAYGVQIMRYLPTDLGIFQALLLFGIPGLMWTLILYIFVFKDLLNSKQLTPQIGLIKDTLIMNFLWLVMTFHSFVWGNYQTFWWGVIIFMVAYLSNVNKKA
jgi:hypothetical protein